jgi:ribosomal subunit interface protein
MIRKKDSSLKVCCKKVMIDARTEEYIKKRMEKIGKFLEKMTKLDYEVEVGMDKKGKFSLEIMVKTPYKTYRAEERSESIEGSVDMAVESLKIQITKDKDKLKEMRERGARSMKKKLTLDENSRFRK